MSEEHQPPVIAETELEMEDFVAETLTGVPKEVREANYRLAKNKRMILDCLARHDIDQVAITWDGSGDSGGIETVEALKGGEVVPLPTEIVTVWREVGSYEQAAGFRFVSRQVEKTQALSEALEGLIYDWLEAHHGGWENDDGGYGEATFNVGGNEITLSHNTRITQIETDEVVL